MSNESVEVQLARLDERWSVIQQEMELARGGRKNQYDVIEALRLSMQTIDNRLVNVEKSIATSQPTIEEFITIKHKVVGAGALGKWLWVIGGFLLGAVAGSREIIMSWLEK